jgi:hypothetical protein
VVVRVGALRLGLIGDFSGSVIAATVLLSTAKTALVADRPA